MDEQLQGDWLDARLRDEAPYLDDNGFTARVVQQLPARRQSHRSFRAVFLILLTLLASTITYVISGGGKFVVTGMHDLLAQPLWLLAITASLVSLLGGSIATWAAVARVRAERQ